MRVRLRFEKLGKVRFVGHRDVARLFERALRKIGFPVTYSEGFNPRVKMSFGLALPTCYESVAEYLDLPIDRESLVDSGDPGGSGDSGESVDGSGSGPLRLEMIGHGRGQALTLDEVADALSAALPDGMRIRQIELQERGGPSLQEAILACTWRFDLPGVDVAAAEAGVERVLGSESLIVERSRKGKTTEEDIRPRVHELYVDGMSERGAVVVAELSASPRVLRPTELLAVLAPGVELGVAQRRHQWIETEGARREPLTPSTSDSNPAAYAGAQEGTTP